MAFCFYWRKGRDGQRDWNDRRLGPFGERLFIMRQELRFPLERLYPGNQPLWSSEGIHFVPLTALVLSSFTGRKQNGGRV